jgi:hypothetical protein
MSVTTVEALEALPVGRTIEVRGRRTFSWTRTERGWESEGALLSSDMFSGHLSAGQVLDVQSSEPTPGTVWFYGGNLYFVTGAVTNEARMRVPTLMYSLAEPDAAAVVQNPLRRHFGGAYVRATPAQIAEVATAHFTEVLMMYVAASAERDQRTQDVRMLKNRPDPTVIQPQVDELATSVAAMQRAIQQMNDTLRSGQSEF